MRSVILVHGAGSGPSVFAGWEAAYSDRLKVKASREHPCEWWMTGGRASTTVRALQEFPLGFR